LADRLAMLVNGANVSAAVLGDPHAAARAKQAAGALLDSRRLVAA
jgi:hypothetical protein